MSLPCRITDRLQARELEKHQDYMRSWICFVVVRNSKCLLLSINVFPAHVNTLSLNADARTHALCLLCRLVLDWSIVNDCSLMVVIEEAFSNLVDAVPEENVEAEVLHLRTSKASTDFDN